MTSDRRYLLLLVSILVMLLGSTNQKTMASAVEAERAWTTGYIKTEGKSYSGEVYLDQNLNGIREFSERGLSEVRVTLETVEGEVIQETYTGFDGEYVLDNIVEEGMYQVRIWPLPGHQTTTNGVFTISTLDPQGMISRATGLFLGLFLPIVFCP